MGEKCPLCGVSFSKIGSLRTHLTEDDSKRKEEIVTEVRK